MSMKTHTVTVKRVAETFDSAGGSILTYATGNRVGNPTTWECRAVLMTAKDKVDHGVRGDKLAWKFMGELNPKITLQDQLTFDFVSGQSHVVKVLVPSHARSTDAAFYRTYGEEDSTES